MPRPIRAEIALGALSANLEVVRNCAPRSKVLSVIKANAYGHGLMRAAHALRASDGFAVLDLNDAVLLREQGFKQPILLLEGAFHAGDLNAAAAYSLSVVIHRGDHLRWMEVADPRPLNVFVKANTGMNRLGFSPSDFPDAVDRMSALPNVEITLMTHFSRADEPAGIDAPLQTFEALASAYALPRSLANSAAIFSAPQTHADWVRPGIALYGSSPFATRSASALGLKPVMTLRSEVIAVQTLAVGETVGYGARFRAERPTRVGVVACGYADGYPRHAPDGTPVLVSGERTRLVGRVSMDMLCVDLTGQPGSGIGAPVVLWGDGLPVDEVAGAAGTIGYELLCAVMPRVPMVERDA